MEVSSDSIRMNAKRRQPLGGWAGRAGVWIVSLETDVKHLLYRGMRIGSVCDKWMNERNDKHKRGRSNLFILILLLLLHIHYIWDEIVERNISNKENYVHA